VSDLVLIVEDDPASLELARDLLQVHGFRTLEAATVEAGIGIANASRPNLILMDLRLPDGDGIAALARLRSDDRTAHIAVVALTAQAMADDRARCLRAGFDGYLSKPIDTHAFPEQVRGYCAEAGASHLER
jgi:CheY-like chemotaxis protein